MAVTALGCKVSAADARRLEGLIAAWGPPLALIPFPDPADVYVLLTCTVTAAADRDTRKLTARLRRTVPGARIVLCGCLAEARPAEAAAVPGVWRVVSHRRMAELPALLAAAATEEREPPPAALPGSDALAPMAASVGRAQGSDAASPPQLSSPAAGDPGPGTLRPLLRGLGRPFLKVQDGCNTGCSYCILPRARGRSRSIPLPEVLAELAALEEQGVAEVVLTGINLGSWGRDLVPRQSLPQLLEAVFSATRLRRLRISSIEPEALTTEVLALLAAAPCFCRHLHVPLQSGDDGVLARMRRRYLSAAYEEVIERAMASLPGCGLGTDLITGFPGEDAAAHERTCALVARLPFSYLHVFTYSARQGTAAAELPDDVLPPEKKRRTRELLELGRKARRRALAAMVGQELELLVERRRDPASGLLAGYSREYLGLLLDEPPAGDRLLGQVVRVRGQSLLDERLLCRLEQGELAADHRAERLPRELGG